MVGGYILKYDFPEPDPYQPIEEAQEQARIKEFVFYSIGKDEELWKLVRSQAELRGKSYSPSKKSIKIRIFNSSSSSSSLRRPVSIDPLQTTSNEYDENMTNSTGMSSNSRQCSYAESLYNENANTLQF